MPSELLAAEPAERQPPCFDQLSLEAFPAVMDIPEYVFRSHHSTPLSATNLRFFSSSGSFPLRRAVSSSLYSFPIEEYYNSLHLRDSLPTNILLFSLGSAKTSKRFLRPQRSSASLQAYKDLSFLLRGIFDSS